MKNVQRIFLMSMLSVYTLALRAQDGLDIDVDLDGPEWYESPIAYVAVGVLLVIAILALRKRK